MKKKTRQLLLLSTLATGCAYGMNKFIDATSEVKKLLTKTEGHFYTWRFGNIFYTKRGTGSPLLLIHELHPAASSNEWNLMIRKLEQDHTVYTIDLLGCGRSDKPNLTYTNYMYVQLLTDFVKNVIGQKTDVIATGSSCSFTLMAAHMDKLIFDKLFLISPPSLSSLQKSPDRSDHWIKQIVNIPIFGTFFYNTQMSEQKITELFETEYCLKTTDVSCKLKDIYYESAHTQHSRGKYLFASIAANYTAINPIPALKNVENPIFLIGSSETQNSCEIMASYQKYDEAIETARTSGYSKLPQMEDPDQLYEILCMFME